MKRRGSILVGLLWALALLAVIVVGVLHKTRTDLTIAKNNGDQLQAYYLAIAGIEKAKAVIFHDAAERKRASVNHSRALYDSPENFRDVVLGRGRFRVVRQDEDGGALAHGVSDEQSRLCANTADPAELAKLYGMTPEVAAALVDWRDDDSNPMPGGAESEYYAGLRPPYIPRNGRIQTARELLLVRGLSAELLMGEDANLNGLLDPEEDDGERSEPPDNRDGRLDSGWAGYLSFESKVQNKNAAGVDRVNVQTADEAALRGVPGITADIARAIVAYRGQNRIENLADLMEVQAMAPASGGAAPPPPPGDGPNRPGQPGGRGRPGGGSGGASAGGPPGAPGAPAMQPAGPKLIDQDLFLRIADDVTTLGESTQEGVVNINTAPIAVLACLPGVTEEIARAIVAERNSAGSFPNIAHLLKVPGVNRELFNQLAPKISARSETFRIVSEGKVGSSGAHRRLEAIVQLDSRAVDTVSYREDL